MKVINQTRNTVLAEDAAVADTLFLRLKGLLGKRALHPQEALVIKNCNSVHTFFMRFAIDVFFVDKKNKIVKIIPSLKPFHITGIYLNSALVIELPAGTAKSTNTQVGDYLRW